MQLEKGIVLQESKLALYLDRRGQYDINNKCELSGRGSVIITRDIAVVAANGNNI